MCFYRQLQFDSPNIESVESATVAAYLCKLTEKSMFEKTNQVHRIRKNA